MANFVPVAGDWIRQRITADPSFTQRLDLVSLLQYDRSLQAHLLSFLDTTSIRALSLTTRTLLYLSHVPPLVHVLTRYTPVQSSLLACLDINDIINLSNTTLRLRPLLEMHLRVQGNINAALENSFDPPVDSRNVQARTNTLIAYEFTYAFMARQLKEATEMDLSLIVGQGEAALELLAYLTREGYAVTETEETERVRELLSHL